VGAGHALQAVATTKGGLSRAQAEKQQDVFFASLDAETARENKAAAAQKARS